MPIEEREYQNNNSSGLDAKVFLIIILAVFSILFCRIFYLKGYVDGIIDAPKFNNSSISKTI